MPSNFQINPASFRDPAGIVFQFNGQIYRAITDHGKADFDFFISSGLYEILQKKGKVIAHQAIAPSSIASQLPIPLNNISHLLQYERIPFISYPYEWSFSQLKTAALLTLDIQAEALRQGMNLKDATSYNIQFTGTHPLFIDTLSFEKHTEGKPWSAYGQFCRHFLAPLALMSYLDISLSKLLLTHLDGIPLDLASSLLPSRTKLNSVLLSHLHVHSRFINQADNNPAAAKKTVSVSKTRLMAMLDHLRSGIAGLKPRKKKSHWNTYQDTHNYTASSHQKKKEIISGWLKTELPGTTWDLGCNTGDFSELASNYSQYVLAIDSDPSCIEALYTRTFKAGSKKILPLIIDAANPSPAIGWNNKERSSLASRGTADMLLALALVHHLRITNQTPWSMIAAQLAEWSNKAIVEFIPSEDSQIREMLINREGQFSDLDFTSFLKAFEPFFHLKERITLEGSDRILCLFHKRAS